MAINYLALIQQTIDYIEDNLTDELSLPKIAEVAQLSMFHFQRVFLSVVGESPCDYVRRRRLTMAAQELLDTDARIFDIALRYQFGSQESFTRSFKAYFGLTPGRYRQRGSRLFIEKPRLTVERLTKLVRGLTLEPKIVEHPGFTVVGLRCASRVSENYLHHFWRTCVDQLARIQVPGSLVYTGLYEPLSHVGFTCDTEFTYLAGIRVDVPGPIPDWLTLRTIPPAKYAVFTRKDKSVTREDAYNYIFSTWFPKSKCKLAELNTLEYYGPSAPGSRTEVEICIPLL